MTNQLELILHTGREKSILQHHPWVFSGAISEVIGSPESGEIVLVRSAMGEPLGWASYSPISQIRARMWTFDPEVQVNEELLGTRILESFKLRRNNPMFKISNAWRMVFAESDGIPGLIVDQYDEMLVVQMLSAGVEYFKPTIISILQGMEGVNGVYERSDVEVRRLEGLPLSKGILSGELPHGALLIEEYGLHFQLDYRDGQKTGFYLDQKENRFLVQAYSKDAEVLNCFSYTGAFSIHALKGGAKNILSVDSSGDALALHERNLFLNGYQNCDSKYLEADVFFQLRKLRDQGRSFDLIILDPPKFAAISSHVQAASRAYKDINLLALKLLKPNGYLFTFSCSGGVSRELFNKIIAGAAHDAHVQARIIHQLHQAPDHPILLSFPESEYLKGLVIQV